MSESERRSEHVVVEAQHFERAIGMLADQIDALRTERDEQLARHDDDMRRLVEETTTRILAGLPKALEHAVHRGIEGVVKDAAIKQQFWSDGFDHLSRKVSDNADAWIGKRIRLAIAAALLTAVVVWAVKSGALK